MVLAPIDLTNTQAYWPVDELRPSEQNPRGPVSPDSVTELADSIRAQGVLQPLLITPAGVVVAGHRRLAAARLAGLRDVPVIVRELSESEMLQIMLVENLQRADLTPMQEARTYQKLKTMGLEESEITRRCGIGKTRLYHRLQLLALDERIQELIDAGEMQVSYAALLWRIPDLGLQRRLGLMAVRRRMTLAALSTLIDKELAEQAKPKTRSGRGPRPTFDKAKTSRRDALAALRTLGTARWSGITVAELVENTCERDCGMSNRDVICRECPVMMLVGRLLA